MLLTPTSPTVAFPFGAKGDNPLQMYLCDLYTIPTNLAGHPGMSVPFGTGDGGSPRRRAGVGRHAWGTASMFRVGAVLERLQRSPHPHQQGKGSGHERDGSCCSRDGPGAHRS